MMIPAEAIPCTDRILYLDSDICVVNKVSGEICESTCVDKENEPFLLPEVFRAEICRRLGVQSLEIFCPHRLDRPVSGAAVLALNDRMVRLLSSGFADSTKTDKTYLAVVEGLYPVSPDWHRESGFIRFDPLKQKAYMCDENQRKAKRAELEWQCAGTGDRYSYIAVKLLTGRTHQIRAQLAAAGMHIKGDVKYGSKRADTLPGIRLHAYKLEFLHPVKGERCSVTAPVPVSDALWNSFFEKYTGAEKESV